MCDKAVDKCSFVFDSVSDQYKIQEMCDKIIPEESFKLKYCNDRYKTQDMCDKAVDDFLREVKLLKNFLLLYTQMTKYSILMEILVMLYFLVAKWVLLV